LADGIKRRPLLAEFIRGTRISRACRCRFYYQSDCNQGNRRWRRGWILMSGSL